MKLLVVLQAQSPISPQAQPVPMLQSIKMLPYPVEMALFLTSPSLVMVCLSVAVLLGFLQTRLAMQSIRCQLSQANASVAHRALSSVVTRSSAIRATEPVSSVFNYLFILINTILQSKHLPFKSAATLLLPVRLTKYPGKNPYYRSQLIRLLQSLLALQSELPSSFWLLQLCLV